jgi:AraC-like DNA-binding protein
MHPILPDRNKPLYPTHLVIAVVETLKSEDIAPAQVLAQSAICANELELAHCRISIEQIVTVIRNALRLSADPGIALKIGRSLHLGRFGILGYAVLSCANHYQLIELLRKYQYIASPMSSMEFFLRAGLAGWKVVPALEINPLGPIYRFCVECRLAAMLTIMRNLYGQKFNFAHVNVAYPAPAHAESYSVLLQCPVHFEQNANEFTFDAALMPMPLSLGDQTSHAQARELCEQALAQIEQHTIVARRAKAEIPDRSNRIPKTNRISSDGHSSAGGVLERRSTLPHEGLPAYPAHLAALILATLEEESVDGSKILAACRLDRAALLSPATRISITQFVSLIKGVQALTKDPAFGLKVGRRLQFGHCGLLGFAIVSSPSREKTVRTILRYDQIMSPLTCIDYVSRNGLNGWRVTPALELDQNTLFYRFSVESKLAGMLSIMKDLYGREFSLKQVSIAYPAPPYAEEYVTQLGCPVLFQQGANEILFEVVRVSGYQSMIDSISHDLACELCERVLENLANCTTLSGCIKIMLLDQLEYSPTMDDMARSLSMSARTLRSKLETEGTTYRKLMNEVRKQLAMTYLRTNDLTIEKISERLGYSDTASFYHAFVRWTGVTPNSYRDQ